MLGRAHAALVGQHCNSSLIPPRTSWRNLFHTPLKCDSRNQPVKTDAGSDRFADKSTTDFRGELIFPAAISPHVYNDPGPLAESIEEAVELRHQLFCSIVRPGRNSNDGYLTFFADRNNVLSQTARSRNRYRN